MAKTTLEQAPQPAPQLREAPAEERELPVVDSPDSQADEPPRITRFRVRRGWVRWTLYALLPIALIISGYWYVTGGEVVSTQDAYVNGQSVAVSTDVSGIVQEVYVTNNQHVSRGQLLYRLDPRPFQNAVDTAKANLAQTKLTLDAMKEDYNRMLSDVAAQQAQVSLDQTNFDRAAALLRSGTAARATYDQAKATLDEDSKKLKSLQQQAQVQLARLGGDPNIQTQQLPTYLQAQAQLAEAQRQLDDSSVKAPFSGTVTDVPATAPGRYLAASTAAFFLVDNDHVWVDANPKETVLTYVRAGQPATITIDTYPDVTWRGTVESISPAAAQQFSLLPAQNTSGNWVKVVQRVPMRVRLDIRPDMPPLRVGMSAEVNVDTGHARGFPNPLSWF